VVFLLFLSVHASKALIFDCTYSVTTVWTQPNLYTCTAKVVYIGDARNVTGVSENHSPGKGNIDVKGLGITGQQIGFVPKDIKRFFPNLESFMIQSAGIREISAEDIEGFPKLRELHLYGNPITQVSNNLFAKTPLVESISFNQNPIQHSSQNVFDHLVNLKRLYLSGSDCLDESAYNRTEVVKLVRKIKVFCPPTTDMVKEENLDSAEFRRKVDEQVAERLNPLQLQVTQLQNRVDFLESQKP
jgi:hypothetical protein